MWKLRRTISNTIAASILLFYIGPFGSQSALQHKADETAGSVLNRLLYEPESQEQIAVVLLDDPAFGDFRNEWPLPRHYWAEAAQILACAGARAIFLDILFDKEATNHTPLKNADQWLWDKDKKDITSFCNKQKIGPAPDKYVPLYFAFTDQPEYWLKEIESDHKLLIAWKTE